MRVPIAAALALWSSGVQAQFPCPDAPIARILSTATFAQFAMAKPKPFTLKTPDVRRGDARSWRTALRRGARGKTNFAGYYSIVELGCGSATHCLAIVDRRNGRVLFDPAVHSVYALSVDGTGPTFDMMTYRPTSRLLIVLGTVNEDEKREGLSYFEFTANRLTLRKFVPRQQLCAGAM